MKLLNHSARRAFNPARHRTSRERAAQGNGILFTKAPRKIDRPRNPDPGADDQFLRPPPFDSGFRLPEKVQTMMLSTDTQGFRQFPGTGSDPQGLSIPGIRYFGNRKFQGPEKNEAFMASVFHQNIEKPMDTVIQVNVSGSDGLPPDELSRAGAAPGVGGFVSEGEIGFGFDDFRGCSLPKKGASHQFASAAERIAAKKIVVQPSHKPVGRSMNDHGSPKRLESSSASAFTPKVSVA
ncbi:MAG: hypothetical protein QM627_03540 [Luteolibacter sp.]